MKVQAVRGHPWASVGILLSPRGVDESQAGVPRAGGVQEMDQGVAPAGVVGGLDCSWMCPALGHAIGLWSPTHREARARGMPWNQSPPTRVANSGTG